MSSAVLLRAHDLYVAPSPRRPVLECPAQGACLWAAGPVQAKRWASRARRGRRGRLRRAGRPSRRHWGDARGRARRAAGGDQRRRRSPTSPTDISRSWRREPDQKRSCVPLRRVDDQVAGSDGGPIARACSCSATISAGRSTTTPPTSRPVAREAGYVLGPPGWARPARRQVVFLHEPLRRARPALDELVAPARGSSYFHGRPGSPGFPGVRPGL